MTTGTARDRDHHVYTRGCGFFRVPFGGHIVKDKTAILMHPRANIERRTFGGDQNRYLIL